MVLFWQLHPPELHKLLSVPSQYLQSEVRFSVVRWHFQWGLTEYILILEGKAFDAFHCVSQGTEVSCFFDKVIVVKLR
jgi:hypothetical protein